MRSSEQGEELTIFRLDETDRSFTLSLVGIGLHFEVLDHTLWAESLPQVVIFFLQLALLRCHDVRGECVASLGLPFGRGAFLLAPY